MGPWCASINSCVDADATRVTKVRLRPRAGRSAARDGRGDRPSAGRGGAACGADEGIPWTTGRSALLSVWQGADESGGASSGADVIRMAGTESSFDGGVGHLACVVRERAPDSSNPIDSARAASAWSRPAGPPSPHAVPADEGDRRWLWAAGVGPPRVGTRAASRTAGQQAAPTRAEEARVA